MTQRPVMTSRAVVIDTNIVLDLLLFAEPAVEPLRQALLQQRLRWLEARQGVLARNVAKKIENELDYPGQIKVSVIRESRATEYAK